MQDRKCNILKTRLEALDYKLPFTSESIPLIEAMLSDISSLHQSLNNLRHSKDFSNTESLSKRIEYINREKQRLKEEIHKEPKSFHLNSDKEVSFSNFSDKRIENKTQKIAPLPILSNQVTDTMAEEFLEKKFQDCSSVKKTLEESKIINRRLAIENQNLNDKLRTLQSQNENLIKQLENYTWNIREKDKENQAGELFSLKEEVSSYESKRIMMQNEVNMLRTELKRSSKQCRNLENYLSIQSKEIIKLRFENEVNSSSRSKASSVIESLQRQLEIITNENNKLHSLREEERKKYNAVEVANYELEAELAKSYEKIRMAVQENQNISELFRQKLESISNSQCKMLDKEQDTYKFFVENYEEVLSTNKRLKDLNESLNVEICKLQHELEENKDRLMDVEKDLYQSHVYLEHANEKIQQFKVSALEESIKTEEFNNMKQNFELLEQKLCQVKSQFEESLSREQQLYKEVDQARLSQQKSEEKLSFAIKQSEQNNTQNLSLECEITKLQRDLSNAIQRENSKILEMNEIEARVQKLNMENEDLRSVIQGSQEENCVLAQELKDCEKMLEEEKTHVERLNEQVSQLKDFIRTLENARNEAIAKIEHMQVNYLDKENAIKMLRDEVSQVKKQILVSEKVCADVSQSQESAIKQMESLKSELSIKNEELTSLKNSSKTYIIEIEDLKNRVKILHESENIMKIRIREQELEKSRLEDQVMKLRTQNQDTQRSLNKTQSIISEMSEKFNLITSDNKKFEENSASLEQENKNLLKKIEEFTKDHRSKHEEISSLLIENEDLSTKCKNTLEDLNKISRSYDHLNTDYKKLLTKVSAADNFSENWKKQEEIWIRNRNGMEEELRRVIRSAEISDFKRIEAEKALEELRKEVQQQRMVAKELDYSSEDLRRKLSLTENEKCFFESRFKAVETEALELKAQLGIERQRVEEFEGKIRKSEFQEQRGKLVQGSSEVVSELYKQIEEYKSESLKLEMEYMKVMEELGKTKKQLCQAEKQISEMEIERRC